MLEFKAVKKGRTKEEVDQVTCWLTGYSRAELEGMAEKAVSYGDFFRNATGYIGREGNFLQSAKIQWWKRESGKFDQKYQKRIMKHE